MARRPFQALLNLLVDPDLQHVELCVWKVHWALFCPFHKKAEATAKGKPPEVVDDHGLATMRGHEDWIQLDRESIVNMLGTGERIMKIKEEDCEH